MLYFDLIKDDGKGHTVLKEDEETLYKIIAQTFRNCNFVNYIDENHWSMDLDTRDRDEWSIGEQLAEKFHIENAEFAVFSTEECKELSDIIKMNSYIDELYYERCVLVNALDEVVENNATLSCNKVD